MGATAPQCCELFVNYFAVYLTGSSSDSPLIEQDDTFFFIAGYTSGGAPYGVTWEQMGLEPWEEIE